MKIFTHKLFFFLFFPLYFTNVFSQNVKPASWNLGIVGDTANVSTTTSFGVALVGGGGNVNSAFKWMISKSGGGDAVVITASGTVAYNQEIYDLGGLNSVQTINITSRDIADNDSVANIIRNAEMVFIGGGDQSRYMNFWRGTKTQEAINYLLREKKVPIGGTSAGCAILSGIYYSGEDGSVVSDEVLKNPFIKGVTLYNNDLLHVPFLQNVLTDQHYLTRKRQGRHVAFLARINKDWGIFANGIAPNERTAVCIDDDGNAKVFGESTAYFIKTDMSRKPEIVKANMPLEWNDNGKALHVYEIQGSDSGAGNFSVADFHPEKASGGKWYDWYVEDGNLKMNPSTDKVEKYVMVIHGGAGTLLKKDITPQLEKDFKLALTNALKAGYEKISGGKSSLDAVQAAIHIMEDSPLFNAGKGAVFTHDGRNEMDAAIMDGSNLMAGAVAGVSNVRNPIDAARAVMEKSEHVMMSGTGAETFAKEAGCVIVPTKYFYTESRWKALQQAIKDESAKPNHAYTPGKLGTINPDLKFGTVGAVALDQKGNLAAGTSTGGMTNKKYGRIGDAPIIGAGTYANNLTVGISCTGWGEFYIRTVVAHDLSALMQYKDLSVQAAGDAVIKKMGDLGGDGGLIALDKYGNVAMPFNTEGMYRGTVTQDGKIEVHIYK
ncbi:MAG: isoaspartyl peptidase/L-asparaginase [Ginsengibacter sp.]